MTKLKRISTVNSMSGERVCRLTIDSATITGENPFAAHFPIRCEDCAAHGMIGLKINVCDDAKYDTPVTKEVGDLAIGRDIFQSRFCRKK